MNRVSSVRQPWHLPLRFPSAWSISDCWCYLQCSEIHTKAMPYKLLLENDETGYQKTKAGSLPGDTGLIKWKTVTLQLLFQLCPNILRAVLQSRIFHLPAFPLSFVGSNILQTHDFSSSLPIFLQYNPQQIFCMHNSFFTFSFFKNPDKCTE